MQICCLFCGTPVRRNESKSSRPVDLQNEVVVRLPDRARPPAADVSASSCDTERGAQEHPAESAKPL